MTDLQKAAKNNALINKQNAFKALQHVKLRFKNNTANALDVLKAKSNHMDAVRFYDSFKSL